MTTSPQFTIKTGADAPLIALAQQLRQAVFVEEQGIPARLDDDGLDDLSLHVVVQHQEKRVTAATGRLSPGERSGAGILSRIAVHPGYRGQQLGKRVVAALESAAKAHGYRELSLAPHAHLQHFYEALGYALVPAPTVYAGKHALITMKKAL